MHECLSCISALRRYAELAVLERTPCEPVSQFWTSTPVESSASVECSSVQAARVGLPCCRFLLWCISCCRVFFLLSIAWPVFLVMVMLLSLRYMLGVCPAAMQDKPLACECGKPFSSEQAMRCRCCAGVCTACATLFPLNRVGARVFINLDKLALGSLLILICRVCLSLIRL